MIVLGSYSNISVSHQYHKASCNVSSRNEKTHRANHVGFELVTPFANVVGVSNEGVNKHDASIFNPRDRRDRY